MRKTALLLFMLVTSVAMAEVGGEITKSIAVDVMPISIEREQCNISNGLIDKAKEMINEQLNTSPYEFSNLTSSYCYGNSVSMEFLFKENEGDYIGKRVSVSLYSYDEFDYDLIFTSKENDKLGYTLKQKYISYLINGTDEEYYVSLSPNYDDKNQCDTLETYYNTLSGEKYFNNDYGYCSIVIKTKTSNVKDLISDSISYLNYWGDEVRFSFTGHSNGDFDLASIAESIDCDLSKNDYYYPEFQSDCYGIYKDKSRVYLSVSDEINNEWVNFNIYGIVNGKARLSANSYGINLSLSEVQSWVNSMINNYIPGQTLELSESSLGFDGERDYKRIAGEKIITGFTFDDSLLDGFEVREQEMNTYYESDNVYATISKPYIQVYVPETETYSSSDLKLIPYYWGRYFVITSDKVYSSINLKENNEALAVDKIKEFIDPYVATSDWVLNMSVSGRWFYPYPLMRAEAAIDSGFEVQSLKTDITSGGIIQDAISNDYSGFEGLEDETQLSTLELIINFFKGLFGIQ